MNDRPILETERLILRRPTEGDIPAIVAIAGDLEISRRLTRVPHPYTETAARFFLNEIVPNEWVWGITLRPPSVLIGMVGLTPGADSQTAELGYYIDPQHWGKGIATEAARAVIYHGQHFLKLHHITARHVADNRASSRVLSKLGFIQVGHGEHRSLATGAAEPSVHLLLQLPPN